MSHLQKLGGASLILSALASINIGFFQQPAQASLLNTTLSFSIVPLIHPSADAKSLDCIHSGINCPQALEEHSVYAVEKVQHR
jgi:hypothetical protein